MKYKFLIYPILAILILGGYWVGIHKQSGNVGGGTTKEWNESGKEYLKLKASPELILYNKKVGNDVVYKYVGEKITFKSKYPYIENNKANKNNLGASNEVMLDEVNRDYNYIDYKLDENTIVKEVHSGIRFVKNINTGEWFFFQTATTTSDSFDGQYSSSTPVSFIYPDILKIKEVLATTDTFYPNANPETTSVDGEVGNDTIATWAGARDAATGNIADSSGGNSWIICERRSDTKYYVDRFFSLFDTSSISDSDTIDSAVYSLNFTGAINLTGYGDTVYSVQTNPASTTNLTTADFDALTFTSGCSFGTISAGYVGCTLNATGLSWISKSGVTRLGAIMGKDLNNSEPSTSNARNYTQINTADGVGTSTDPKLVIVHSISAVSSPVANIINFE